MLSIKNLAAWVVPPIGSIFVVLWLLAHRDAEIDNHETRLAKIEAAQVTQVDHEARITKLEAAQAAARDQMNEINVTLGRIDERMTLLLRYFSVNPSLKGPKS